MTKKKAPRESNAGATTPKEEASMQPEPNADWTWRGTAGHFIGSHSCCFRLHTTVGEYRVSTVGCYHPASAIDDTPHEIGSGRLYETMVFRNKVDGEVDAWVELDADAYNDETAAEAGHVTMCEKWSRLGVAV